MSRRTPLLAVVAALAALMATLLVPGHANAAPVVAANPYERGPAPAELDLGARTGPFAYESRELTAAQTGTGVAAATLFYPSEEEGTFGAVAILPGFTNTRSAVAWYGPLLASHGYVVMTLNTNTTLDQPSSRATQQLRALEFLASPNNPVVDKVDPDRLGVMGYSMGGGGALEATARNTEIKASIPLTPWHTTKNFPAVETPTLIIGAQNDGTAPVASHARPHYEGLSDDIAKAYYELRGAPHSVPTSYNATIAKLTVSWMKRFVDDDYRFDAVLCPHADDTATFSQVRSTCDYTPDSDGDGVSDPYDHCADTVLPDQLVALSAAPTANARTTTAQQNRFAADVDGRFVAASGVDSGYTVADTGGCSAAQIIAGSGLGQGHSQFGLTLEALDAWVAGLTTAA
jgi:dienelactone hydrolase